MACQAQKPVAVAAFGEVQGHRALIFGVSHDGREKRWTSLSDVVGRYFDVGESEVVEKGQEDETSHGRA